MSISRLTLTLILIALLSIFVGCSKRQSADFEKALGLYRENKLEQTVTLFEKLINENGTNPEYYVWLAETYRRLGDKEKAIKTARRALELNPKSSFAHTVIADASDPIEGEWAQANSDTTWYHLLKAVECDSTDGNSWLSIWIESMHRIEPTMTRRALRKLSETGFFTKAALSYGRWMLRALPENAILITNGDMDTYPPCVVQEVEGFRRDVVIVNRGLLNVDWYARFIRDYAGAPLPFNDSQLNRLQAYKDRQGNLVTPSDQIFQGWLEQKAKGSLNRPLTIAVSVEETFYSSIRNNLRFAGPFLLWDAVPSVGMYDSSAMYKSLEGLNPDDFTGPWVSEQDRSPIRRIYTKKGVSNVTVTALAYSELLLEAKRISEANRWINWADELDRKSELGPVFSEKIAQLKARCATTSDGK